MSESCVAIYWFRKALRLHDNSSLVNAVKRSKHLYPIFILDPDFKKFAKVGPIRWRFLIQSLNDLDSSLKNVGLRLLVVRGTPIKVMSELIRKWNVNLIAYETDTEPYALKRDAAINELAKQLNVKLETTLGHTLYDPKLVLERSPSKKTPFTYQGFLGTIDKIGPPPKPVQIPDFSHLNPIHKNAFDESYKLPTLKELGVDESDCGPCLYIGGETEALRRMDACLANHRWVSNFAKPDTSPNSVEPSTTVLSPYLKFGCLSCRTFYYKLKEILKSNPKHTKPPVSLIGQLLWREFFYSNAALTPNFDKMVGNHLCKQIPWTTNNEHVEAWKYGRTGYPFIDAIMTQLRTEGWIHHLARHAVACFLTRGDLWISWEEGLQVFEEYLLDADWSLNAGNWLWLSASAFFHQYFRIYSPIAFGRKTDPNGDYIRKYIPILSKYPKEYIYEPWKAPKDAQKRWGCMIGVDYPKPIVDHEIARKTNLQRMSAAYKAAKSEVKEEPIVEEEGDVLVSPIKKRKMK